ncbi:ABC transporter substrate-binding protein [Undibacterium sp. Di26W]|uniref:ABC transporter substrate-binding protein n=1 Tax=Undibacterium sp. Di26W TaxID=3413035 RepID=UPI003BF0A1AE
MKTVKHLVLLIAVFAMQLYSTATMAQTPVVFGYTGISDFAAAFVAKDKGFFKKRGLDVELQLITLTSNIPPALQSDSIQVGGIAPSTLLQAASGGLDLVTFASASLSDSSAKNPGLLVRAGTDMNTPADFIGKKIGVPGLGGALHVLIRKWFFYKGVDTKKINFVEIPFPQMNDVLKGGNVDAVVVADPFMSRIEQSGVGVIYANLSKDLPDGFSVVVYASTRQWVKKNPVALKAINEALVEAVEFALANPQATRSIIGKYVKVPPQVLETLPIPKLANNISPEHLKFWVTAMRQQEMFKAPNKEAYKNTPDIASIIVR